MSKKYLVQTFGCQMNEHDSERISGLLEEDGYSETRNVNEADAIVLNTCCIRENADNKLYGALGNLKPLKDKNPGLQIVVAGCLAQKDKELISQRASHVDVVLGTHNVSRAVELMYEAKKNGPVTEIWDQADPDQETFASALPASRASDFAAWLTIQVGCDNSCAFCIVPSVRGKEISRPTEEIVADVKQLASEGVTEITLLGQNVNSYGRDLALAQRKLDGTTRPKALFAQLLSEVAAVDGIRQVRFTSPHPKDMNQDVFDVMASHSNIAAHLHFPLQSGSDKVLAKMHRGYTTNRFLAKIAAARATVDDLAVSTDIIVGFPGETEEDFQGTLQVAAEAQFDNAYTFVFSPRSGTEAAEMVADFCDPDEVADRYERLRTVTERSASMKYAARIGTVEEVVVEGRSKKNDRQLTGRTAHNKLVHFESAFLKPGTYVRVEVKESSFQYLVGDLVEVTERPRYRTKLALVDG